MDGAWMCLFNWHLSSKLAHKARILTTALQMMPTIGDLLCYWCGAYLGLTSLGFRVHFLYPLSWASTGLLEFSLHLTG